MRAINRLTFWMNGFLAALLVAVLGVSGAGRQALRRSAAAGAPAGRIAGVVNPPSVQKYGFWTDPPHAPRGVLRKAKSAQESDFF